MRVIVAAVVSAVFAGCSSLPRHIAPWADSMSDGCSIPGGECGLSIPFTPDQHACCVRHDRAYYFGGSVNDRYSADNALRACMLAAGLDPVLTDVIFTGVRVGGGPEFRRPGISWAFGGKVFAYTRRPQQ